MSPFPRMLRMKTPEPHVTRIRGASERHDYFDVGVLVVAFDLTVR